MHTNGVKDHTNGAKDRTNGTNGVKDRLKLTLVESKPLPAEDTRPTRRDERALKMVADRLAEALEDVEQAVHAGGDAELAPRLRSLYEELVELQEAAARELGRAVGERVATLNRWRVRRGIEVAEARR